MDNELSDYCAANFVAGFFSKLSSIIAVAIYFLFLFMLYTTESTNSVTEDVPSLLLELQKFQYFADLLSVVTLTTIINKGAQKAVMVWTEDYSGIRAGASVCLTIMGVLIYMAINIVIRPLVTTSRIITFIILTFIAIVIC